MPEGLRRILIIKLRYIGDVVLATPVLRALRDRFPDARLSMVVNPGTEDVIKWNPDLNEALVVAREELSAQLQFLREIRRRRFDCVIDLTDGDRAAILAWVSGAPVRIGYNSEQRWRGWLYTRIVPIKVGTTHMVEYHLAAVRALGFEPNVSLPVLHVRAEHERAANRLLAELGVSTGAKLVMIHPGARYWFRKWPADRFAAVADSLTKAECQVLVAGDVRDEPMAAAMLTATKSPPVSLVGRTTLLELAAVMKRCSLVIAHESGPSHVAAAVGAPVLALYGKGNPAIWGPRGRRVVVLHKGVNCTACKHPTCIKGEDSCMKQISVEDVLEAAWRCLN